MLPDVNPGSGSEEEKVRECRAWDVYCEELGYCYFIGLITQQLDHGGLSEQNARDLLDETSRAAIRMNCPLFMQVLEERAKWNDQHPAE